MTNHHRTKGFVFKKQDRGEADRIFSVFTKDFGKLEIRGKAIRKINSKLRAGIDSFYFSEIEFIQGKNYKTLTDAIVLEKPKLTLARLEFLKRISELLDNFIKGQEKDEKIYSLLSVIARSEATKQSMLYYYFFWIFFSELGYMPHLESCAKCSVKLNPYDLYFSCKDGGVVCKKCSFSLKDAKKINSDIVKILRIILKKDWQILERLKIGQASEKLLSQITEDFYLWQKSIL